MDRPAVGQRLSLQLSAEVCHPRPRQDLWRELRSSSACDGNRAGPHRAAVAVAEPVLRARFEPSPTHVRTRAPSAWSPPRSSQLTSRNGRGFEERKPDDPAQHECPGTENLPMMPRPPTRVRLLSGLSVARSLARGLERPIALDAADGVEGGRPAGDEVEQAMQGNLGAACFNHRGHSNVARRQARKRQ